MAGAKACDQTRLVLDDLARAVEGGNNQRDRSLVWGGVHLIRGPTAAGWLPIDAHCNPDSEGALPIPVGVNRDARQLLLEVLDPLESGDSFGLVHMANIMAARPPVRLLHDSVCYTTLRQLAAGGLLRKRSLVTARLVRSCV
jgi:hypothetical protein